jgi:Transcription factor WhiB
MSDRDWMTHAACRDYPDPDLWFRGEEKGIESTRRLAQAQAICEGCPVTAQCKKYCRETGSAFGVWGGTEIQTQVYGSTGRTKAMHGTEAMYKRHLRKNETPCHSCRVASQRARALRWRETGT